MDDSSFHDLLRRWADDALSADERAQFERALAEDPKRRAFAEQYREVHRLTAALESTEARGVSPGLGPDLDGTTVDPPSAWRLAPLAAAAVLLLGIAAFTWWGAKHHPSGDDPRVTLSWLRPGLPWPAPGELENDVDHAIDAAQLATLVAYRPVADGGVQWLRNRELAASVAECSGRTVLLYGGFRDCPLCVELNERVFVDPEVQTLIGDTVPLYVDLASLSETESEAWMANGYPVLRVESARGKVLESLSGMTTAARFATDLESALDLGSYAGLVEWEECHELARYLQEAQAAREAGAWGEADALFALILDVRPDGGFAEIARRGRDDVQRAAWETFEALRMRWVEDLPGALEQCREAERNFHDSVYTEDFAKLRAVLEQSIRPDPHFAADV